MVLPHLLDNASLIKQSATLANKTVKYSNRTVNFTFALKTVHLL